MLQNMFSKRMINTYCILKRCVAGVPGAGGRPAARVRGERRGAEHGGNRGHHLPARPLRGHQALHRRVGSTWS